MKSKISLAKPYHVDFKISFHHIQVRPFGTPPQFDKIYQFNINLTPTKSGCSLCQPSATNLLNVFLTGRQEGRTISSNVAITPSHRLRHTSNVSLCLDFLFVSGRRSGEGGWLFWLRESDKTQWQTLLRCIRMIHSVHIAGTSARCLNGLVHYGFL